MTIDGVAVQITTTHGHTAAQVAEVLAAAINANSQLQALYNVASVQGRLVVVTGSFDSLEIHDLGLGTDGFGVPTTGVPARGLLVLSLILSWLHVIQIRQRRSSSPSPTQP